MRFRVKSWAHTGVPLMLHRGCLLRSEVWPRPPPVPRLVRVAPGRSVRNHVTRRGGWTAAAGLRCRVTLSSASGREDLILVF